MAILKSMAVIGKLRPRVARANTVELDTLADEIAEQSGFDRGDSRAFAYKFSQALIRHLQFGDYVKLGEIGSFYVDCDSHKAIKVNYRPSKDIKQAVADNFKGQINNPTHTGLDEEGYVALWLELHPEDTVIMRDGSARTK